jgi:hypothetical protein
MNIVAKLEAELRDLEAQFARKSDALAKLQEDYRAKYALLFAAKAQRSKNTAKQIVEAGAKRRAEIIDLPTNPTARAIVLAGRKARGEIE